MSQALRDARRFEEGASRRIAPESRPAFHLSSRTGWMNDPNGFSLYEGKYHLFYQYHPYDSHWGPMHWGHAVSEDLLHWEYLPAAMAPDMPYDRDGCFSGSALTLPDGRHLLMYTGVAETVDEHGAIRHLQTQNLAFGDGLNYRKYAHNPVITGDQLPPGGSRYDFRDPKIFQAPDGTFRALVVDDHETERGQVLLFKSPDALHWEYVSTLASNGDRLGLMWECPDLFRLDGYDVLLLSAQDMLPKGFEYHNGDGSFYLLGHYDETTDTFTELSDHAADYGIDFYAPQTILTPDGRRIMIGWMQNWDTCNLHTPQVPWFGQMSLPRELSVRDGILYQQPLRELEAYRSEPLSFTGVTVENDEISLPGLSGRTLDLTLELHPCEGDLFDRFAVRFAKNETCHIGVSFRPRESVLKVDRKFSGSRRAIIHQRRAKVRHDHGGIKLRLILDRHSVEVFVNDGEKVMTAAFDTDPSADQITFFAQGKVTLDVLSYTLNV